MKTSWIVSLIVGAISAVAVGSIGYYLYHYWTLFYFIGVTGLALSWFPLLKALRRTDQAPMKAFMIGSSLGLIGPFLYSMFR